MSNDDDAGHDNYCQTCGRALTRLTGPDGAVSYFHDGPTRTVDHEIVRVPLHEVERPVLFCDFCGGPPVWTYLCGDVHVAYEDQTRIVGMGEGERTGRYDGRIRIVTRREAERMGLTGPGVMGASAGRWWAACADCAVCLDGGDIWGLVSRATDQFPARATRGRRLAELRANLHELYEPVFATLALKMPLGSREESE